MSQNAILEAANVDMVIIPRTGDIGNFKVQRALPFKDKRMVGPFIFWDQMGPGEFLKGTGVDVRPHPHIGLSTVTYLFDGCLDHKDSLNNSLRIVPGDLNLMTAGKGIVHSERTGQDIRSEASSLFGIQSWLAQPQSKENGDPSFVHYAKSELPEFSDFGVRGRVILGNFLGTQSKVLTDWDTHYVDLNLQRGFSIELPRDIEERALYPIDAPILVNGQKFPAGQMLILKPGSATIIKADSSDLRVMLLGGAAMDGPRHIWWNFVSSSKERIEEAKRDWKDGKFAAVPDDDQFIPLPE